MLIGKTCRALRRAAMPAAEAHHDEHHPRRGLRPDVDGLQQHRDGHEEGLAQQEQVALGTLVLVEAAEHIDEHIA